MYFVFLSFFLSECDVEYVSPSEYQSSSQNDDDSSAGDNKAKNGYEDPYEKMVKGNLDLLEKEKVSDFGATCSLEVCSGV